jgi:protein TonB
MSSGSRQTAFIVASLLIHAAAFAELRAVSARKPPVRRQPIDLTLREPPPPPPEPEKPKPLDLRKEVQVVKKAALTPPSEPPKSAEPPPPPVFGLSMSSVSADGGFAMPTGNTTMIEPSASSRPVKPLSGAGSGGPPVSVTQVSKMPSVVGACPPGNPHSLYTAAALDHEVEGKVVLDIVIDESGQVIDAKVQKGLGYGLDEAAARAMKEKCRFDPAEVNGRKVSTTIRYTFTFVLDE